MMCRYAAECRAYAPGSCERDPINCFIAALLERRDEEIRRLKRILEDCSQMLKEAGSGG